MKKFRINGGRRLSGNVEISGAKNAVVAILPAVLLSEEPCHIENIPNISDVETSLKILEALGASVERVGRDAVIIDPRCVNTNEVDHNLARSMRASYYYIGALLGKGGSARVPMPGGCNFGVRPIDLHLKGFSALGASYQMLEQGIIEVTAEKLVGKVVNFDTVSVGATVNVILAAVRAEGITVIRNAAREPHIVDLANFLNSMGADVRGAGTDVIKIHGVDKLYGARYSIIPDQIEAGTYMALALATGGDITVCNVIPKHLESITERLAEMGADVEEMDDAVRVRCDSRLQACHIKTMPHPGFPTDMQPQFGVLMCIADGTSSITEGVWESRFRYVEELIRMGARVSVENRKATFQGVTNLTGAPVRAMDLRAGAAMVIAGLAASGVTEVEDIHYIERGYENVVEKLTALGADIERIEI